MRLRVPDEAERPDLALNLVLFAGPLVIGIVCLVAYFMYGGMYASEWFLYIGLVCAAVALERVVVHLVSRKHDDEPQDSSE